MQKTSIPRPPAAEPRSATSTARAGGRERGGGLEPEPPTDCEEGGSRGGGRGCACGESATSRSGRRSCSPGPTRQHARPVPPCHRRAAAAARRIGGCGLPWPRRGRVVIPAARPDAEAAAFAAFLLWLPPPPAATTSESRSRLSRQRHSAVEDGLRGGGKGAGLRHSPHAGELQSISAAGPHQADPSPKAFSSAPSGRRGWGGGMEEGARVEGGMGTQSGACLSSCSRRLRCSLWRCSRSILALPSPPPPSPPPLASPPLPPSLALSQSRERE
jgi:hypothetical protein